MKADGHLLRAGLPEATPANAYRARVLLTLAEPRRDLSAVIARLARVLQLCAAATDHRRDLAAEVLALHEAAAALTDSTHRAAVVVAEDTAA